MCLQVHHSPHYSLVSCTQDLNHLSSQTVCPLKIFQGKSNHPSNVTMNNANLSLPQPSSKHHTHFQICSEYLPQNICQSVLSSFLLCFLPSFFFFFRQRLGSWWVKLIWKRMICAMVRVQAGNYGI